MQIKKIFIIFIVCIVMLTSCKNDNSLSNVPTNDGNAAQEVNANSSTEKTTPTTLGNATINYNESAESSTGDIIEFKEKLFIAQINDVYYNAGDYLGKTIKYEGILDVYEIPDTNIKYYYVIRYGPGCCGDDGNVGFEVTWNNDYPAPNEWVEAIGVLEEYEEDGYKYLRLALSSLTVLDTRGEEYVFQ